MCHQRIRKMTHEPQHRRSSASLRRSSSLIFCILSSWRQYSCRSDSYLASTRLFSSSAFILASSAFHNSSFSMFDFGASAYLLRLWVFAALWLLDVDPLLLYVWDFIVDSSVDSQGWWPLVLSLFVTLSFYILLCYLNSKQFWQAIVRFWVFVSVRMHCTILFVPLVRNLLTIHALARYCSGHTLLLGNSISVLIMFICAWRGGAETNADSAIIASICLWLIFLT